MQVLMQQCRENRFASICASIAVQQSRLTLSSLETKWLQIGLGRKGSGPAHPAAQGALLCCRSHLP